MDLTLTPPARDLIRRRGGTVALDLIGSVGCGKPSELAADTYLKGKDLGRYLAVQDEDVEVLVAPNLARQVTALHVTTAGRGPWRRLRLTAAGLPATNGSCAV